ncbi:uncharacterized protein MYCGRDRAFT_107949 [Zymoseptoria tritici IPO323]|uniref:Ubiquitin-like domain-containing protein n=1 Tax=Zymoseptoria tritici (strain CBS 115943 / IPO323) TaxID=336722 RepID=F9X2S8_ZYMTI|nr:uncharacterized protein MYCGRDRAFT_107949 [Zymoseptoria tritici IPO323]EGP90643.1 hypothetical protein MYCGRDRAFT_107949 [Zymoseptoria tritici IPO323]
MAPPQDPPEKITLRIKVAPGHVASGSEEFTLGSDIPVASRVGQIRERIQQALPTHPTPERQRILYAGRALVDNDVSLAEALNIRREPSQNEYVVHLLVKGDGTAQVPPHRPVSAGSATIPPTVAAGQAGQVAATSQAHQDPAVLQQAALQHQAAVAQAQQMHARILSTNPFQQRMMPQAGAFAVPNGPIGGNHVQTHGWPGQPNIAVAGTPPQGQGQDGGQTGRLNAPTGEANLSQQTDGSQAQAQPDAQNRPRAGTQHAHIQGVLPSGERITIHQQTMTFPQGGMPSPHLHHGLRLMQATNLFNTPGQPPSTGTSALDRARDNIASMRQILEELRDDSTLAEQHARNARLLEQIQALDNYIDPLHLGTVNNGPVRRASPAGGPQTMQGRQSPFGQPSWQQRAQQMRQAQQPAANPVPSAGEVTCYLLSSPTGPRALLYSPEHGAYTGGLSTQNASNGTGVRPTPTSATFDGAANPPAPEQGQPNAGIVPAQAQPAAQAAAAVEPDPMGVLGPFFNHFWLTLRILIFSYFVLGSNMGWRRPVALMAIGLGFWLIRIGVQGDGPIRRWWEGVVNHGQQPDPAQAGQEGQQPAGAPAQAGQMPTPEQVAQRLIDEANRARGDARNGRVQWVRERLRPVERSVALLVASLWPGVGEAYVRAREEEDRRRAEAEVAARRSEEEERKKREDEEKARAEGEQHPKADADVAGSASGAVEAATNQSEKSPAAQQAFSA